LPFAFCLLPCVAHYRAAVVGMFDLFRSRDRLVRILLGGLLLIVALSMVTYLIPSYGSGDRGPDTVVAEIGKETITAHEIQLAVQNGLRARGMQQDMVAFYVPQMVEQMVTQRALVYEAQRLGIRANDQDVYNAIRVMAPSLFPGGQFVGRDAYAAMLAQQNLTIPEFEGGVARDIMVSRLQDIVVSGMVVTPAEIEQEYRRRNEKASVEYVKLTPEKFKAEVEVSPAEIKAYYDKNRTAFPIPEKKNLEILILGQGKIEQAIQPTDAELHRAYESEKEKFRSPERILTRHILLRAGKTPDEDAKLKAKAEDLVKQLRAGADFAALATKNSEDPGSGPKGGDLGWLVRGQTVKPFEDAAFALKPKEISDPVKSQFGYHVIQVQDHQQPHLQTFEEVRAQLTDEIRKQRASQMMQDLIDRAQAALKKEPADAVAKELNLDPPVKVENIGPGAPIPTIGANKDFDQSLNGLQKGEVSQPVSLPANRVALTVVTGIVPTHPATLEESQVRIRQILEEQKSTQKVTDRANELMAKAKAMNGDLEKAAKSMGLEAKTPPPFSRSSAVEGLGPSASLGPAFAESDGSLIGPIPIPGGRVIAKVLSHVPADMSQLAAQSTGLREELRRKKATERNELFEMGLREQLIKEGKVKIHQNVVKQLVASYRG
jgi:peptidyl-prolyl cis-trans isomerase D